MFFHPGLQGQLHLLQFAGEEMVRAFDPYQLRRRSCAGDDGFDRRPGTILILRSADKQFGLAAAGEEE